MENLDLVSFIRKKKEERRDISSEDVKMIYNKIQGSTLPNSSVKEAVLELTNLACLEVSQFEGKSKKNTVDLLTKIILYGHSFSLVLNEDSKKIMNKLASVMLREEESVAILFTKIIQEFLSGEGRSKDKNPDKNYMSYFGPFYDVLSKKAQSLQRIHESIPFLSPESVEIDQWGNKLKKVTLEHSITYYTEIISHLLMVIDYNFLECEKLFQKVQEILIDQIIGFQHIELDTLKDTIAPEYYCELIFSIHKTLTLVYKLLHRFKNTKEQEIPKRSFPTMSENIERMVKTILRQTRDSRDLIKLLIHVLKNTDHKHVKQVCDCFININSYSSLRMCHGFILENFEDILGKNLFKSNSINWPSQDFINIVVSYTNIMKQLLPRTSDSQHPPPITKLTFSQYSCLIENLVQVIFDNRIYHSHYARTLEDIKTLLEVLKKDVENKGSISGSLLAGNKSKSKYVDFLKKILQKMVFQLKTTRDCLKDLIAYLREHNIQVSPQKGSRGVIDETIFKEMPRCEESSTPEEFHEKVMKFIDKAEPLLNDENAYYYLVYHKLKNTPLLEDREGFIVNAVAVNSKSKSSNLSSLEENIFKRIGLINEITSLLFLEIASISFENEMGHRELPAGSNSGSRYLTQTYKEDEIYYLKKLFKYNLHIFLTLSQDTRLIKENLESFKFSCLSFERKQGDKDVCINHRQLYMMIEENLQTILVILLNFIKNSDSYPKFFFVFFDCFCGTDFQFQDTSPDRQAMQGGERNNMNSLHTFTLFCEILIKNMMIMFNKLPEKLDSFHFLYDKDVNVHFFFLRVLKLIFRAIKLKEDTNKHYVRNLIDSLKKHIFRLIMVTIKLSITQYYPMDYLSLLKIIFRCVQRCDYFTVYFIQEIKEKQIRIWDYFIQLYKSNIEELKIMATELVLLMPLDLKYFIIKYPDTAKDFISIITFALTLHPSYIILKALQILEYVIASSWLLKEEALQLLEHDAEDLFKNLKSLVIFFKHRDYFFKSSTIIENSSIPFAIKIMARLAPFVRNLYIPIKFKCNDDYIIDLEKKEERRKTAEEAQFEEMMDMEFPPAEQVSEGIFDFDIKEKGPNGKKFKFTWMPTLISVLQTLEFLKTKPTIYIYTPVSHNINFISTLRHHVGLEKIHRFLNYIMNMLMFSKNEDIENYFKSRQDKQDSSQSRHSQQILDEAASEAQLTSPWKDIVEAISLKSISDKFLLQRVSESTFQVVSYVIVNLIKEIREATCSQLREAMFALAKKALDEKCTTDYLKHNFICMFETVHSCIHHYIVMQRDTIPSDQFKNCYMIIEEILDYTCTVSPALGVSLRKYSFKLLLGLLYSSDKTQVTGGLIYLSNLAAAKRSLDLFDEYILETLSGLFSLMNRLSCKFNLTVQKKSMELSKIVLIHYKETRKEKEKIKSVRKLISFFVGLIPINKQYEQRLLISLMNILLDGIQRATLLEIMCGKPWKLEEKIVIGDILNNKEYCERNSPLYIILEYIFSVLRSYKCIIQTKNPTISAFKELSFDDCSNLTSVVIVINCLFKWNLQFKLFAGNRFDPHVQEIIDILLEIIKENEEFNEKKMGGRGSSVKPENKNRSQLGVSMHPSAASRIPMNATETASVRTETVGFSHPQSPVPSESAQSQAPEPAPAQPPAPPTSDYKANNQIYYQSIEYRIFVDDYDFQIQGWSMLVESIVFFLFTFLTKQEVMDYCHQKKNIKNHSTVVTRHTIISKMFDLFSRVEFRIRDSVEKGFIRLIKSKPMDVDIMPKDMLSQCFTPMLAFMRNNDPKDQRNTSLNENSMYYFRKLFQLFHSCFNTKRLLEKFDQYLVSCMDIINKEPTPVSEEQIYQLNSIFKMFALIIKNDDFTKMMLKGLEIENQIEKKNIYYFSIKSKLEKLLSSQPSVVVGNFTKAKFNSDNNYFNFLLEMLKKKENHPLRDKICREDPTENFRTMRDYLNEGKINKEDYKKRHYRWAKFVYKLIKKLPYSLSRNPKLLAYFKDQLREHLQNIHLLDDKTPEGPELCQEFLLTLKFLVEAVSHSPEALTDEKIEIIFMLFDLTDMKICYFLGFLSSFFRTTLPTKFSSDLKKKIFMKYLSLYSVTDSKYSLSSTNEYYLRQCNFVLVQPILSHIFEKEVVESSFLFSTEVIGELKKIICPDICSWKLVELTLLLDYILAKVDLKTIRYEKMSLTQSEINEFLKSMILFAWKNIVRKYETSKILTNLSKLLVSRIKSRSLALNDSIQNIYELFTSVLRPSENVVDEENKNIWLETCDVILPEIKANNDQFEENVNKSPSFWLDNFINAMEYKESGHEPSKESSGGSQRWWIAIFRNRHLIQPQRNLIVNSNRFYSYLNSHIHTARTPYIVLDILLLYITWYMQDYKKCIQEGQPTDNIFGLNYQRENFFFSNILLELIKLDEDNYNALFERAYFLIRCFLLFLGKSRFNYDIYINLLQYSRKKSHIGREENPLYQGKRLRMNFVILNVLLAVLYHPKIDENKQKMEELFKTLLEYIFKEITLKQSKDYIKYPYLIPLSYQIIKKIVSLSEENKQSELIDVIKNKVKDSVKTIIMKSEKDSIPKPHEASDILSVWLAVLLYRLLFEIKPECIRDHLEKCKRIADVFCEQLASKKNIRENPQADEFTFDENVDLLDKLFYCSNAESPEKRFYIRGYYKGYMIIMLRILTRFFDKQSLQALEVNAPGQSPAIQEPTLLDYFSSLLHKQMPSSDYNIRIEVLMLMRCLLIPQTVKSPIYRGIAKDKDFLSLNQKIFILQILKPEHFLKKDEMKKPSTKLFMEYYWNLIVDFLDAHPNCKAMTKFMRKICLLDVYSISLKKKDQVINKLNELNQDYHFGKFLILPNLEFSNMVVPGFIEPLDNKADIEQTIDNLKKYNLVVGAHFAKNAEIKASLLEKRQHILEQFFEEEREGMDEESNEPSKSNLYKFDQHPGLKISHSPDIYKLEEISDIKAYFNKHALSFKKNMQEKMLSRKFFKSYRYILDMERFEEVRNTLPFWKDYIKQLWAQSTQQEKERLWMTLQELLSYPLNGDDYIFILETLKELNTPAMHLEQCNLVARKANMFYPLAAVNYLETYLDKNLQKEWNIPPDVVFSCFENCLEDLKEKDLALGFRKTYLDKERDKNMLTMLQVRDYHGAEDLCEEIIEESEVFIPNQESLKNYIEKTIIQDSWIEIQKNFNEWNSLYELARETERKDLLVEAAYFTQNTETLEGILKPNLDEENLLSFIYLITGVLIQEELKIQNQNSEANPVSSKVEKSIKEITYCLLMKDWFSLPKVFSENQIYQIVTMAQMVIEFEEGFDLIQSFKPKKHSEQNKYIQFVPKLKDELTSTNQFRRQRIPNEADGILNTRRILEQRTITSHILNGKMKYHIEEMNKATSSNTFMDDKKSNIFNETHHYAIMYCKTERQFGIYSSIQKISEQMNHSIDSKMLATEAEEFYYYHELLKMWDADDSAKDPPERVLNILKNPTFNQYYKSDLHETLMKGYLEKNMLEKANEHGIEGLKLYEDNWKLWSVWFHFFTKLYHRPANIEKNLIYLKEMLKAYSRAIKFKPVRNLLLFSEILNILYFRDDLIKNKFNADDSQKEEIVHAFTCLLTDTPVWTWSIWLGNLVLNVYKKNTLKLDEVILKALNISAQNYKAYIHHVLNSILKANDSGKDNESKKDTDPRKDNELEDIFGRCKNNPLVNLRFQDMHTNKLFTVFEAEELNSKNDYPEALSSLYSSSTIDARLVSQLQLKCKEIATAEGQRGGVEASQRVMSMLGLINDYLVKQQSFINKKPRASLNSQSLGTKLGIINSSHYYSEKTLSEFFLEAYLLPDIKVIYEARRFGLQVEFLTTKHKKLVYTVKNSSNVNAAHLMCYNHYLKLMNIEMTRGNETVYRALRFEPLDIMYLEDDYCLKRKAPSEFQLVELLDEEMARLDLKPDHALELFASKKSVSEVNKTMMEIVSPDVLKKEVLKRLRSEFDLFLWKKRYAQSLAVNMINSLIFVKDHSFENLRIVMSSADYFDDNIIFKIDSIQKNKPPSKPPLRLTQNNKYLLQEYMIEGALLPSITSIGTTLLANPAKQFSIATLTGLFLKDFYFNSPEDRGNIQRTIEANVEGYFLALMKMTVNYEVGSGKNTRNPAFSSLRAFMDFLSNEDNLRILPLSFRAWF